MNFWYNPQHISWVVDLVTVFLMGIMHGITPDEHTWPITFSYSVGSYSTRGGMRAGLLFSLAFTLQRAIASELAYFALAGFLLRPGAEAIVYLLVGVVMAASGYFILYRRKSLHLFPWLERLAPALPNHAAPVPVKLALIHGFIAGWGTGAFATIIYTVFSPRMPNAWMGFVPGLLYGLGTMLMQIAIGALFGRWVESRKLGDVAKSLVGRMVAGNTLFMGGILFTIAGAVERLNPRIVAWSVPTGLHIFNLDSINVGLLLIILVVGGVGGVSMWRAMRQAQTVSRLPLR